MLARLSNLAARFRGYLASLWLRAEPPAPPLPIVESPAPSPTPTPLRTAPAPEPTEQLVGHHSLRVDLLDRLDDYFVYIKRLKLADAEGYALYSRIGAHIPSPDQRFSMVNIEPAFLRAMPTFGAIATMDRDAAGSHLIGSKFLYFRKYRPGMGPWDVQAAPAGTSLYVVTVYFDDAFDKKIKRYGTGLGWEYCVAVSPQGQVQVLRQLLSQTQMIRHRRRGSDPGGASRVHHTRWGLHPVLIDWAAEHSLKPAELLHQHFCAVANSWLGAASATVRIAASKAEATAVFGVDPLRLPKFFDDRTEVRTPSGRRAPMFHIVRPHARTLKSGKRIGVKAYFSGINHFEWNGYDIQITVPGKDHVSITEFGFGAADAEHAPALGSGYWGMRDVGAYLQSYLARRPQRRSIRVVH